MHGAVHASLCRRHAGSWCARIHDLRDCRRFAGFRSARERDRDFCPHVHALTKEMVTSMVSGKKKIEVTDLRLSYGAREVIHGISFDIYENEILGIIGPAQSGKTSLLRCINRTIEFVANARVSGSLKVQGIEVTKQDAFGLRRRIGMVAPLPVGLPLTIYDNVAFAPRCSGVRKKAELDTLVEKCLRQA